jgi:succinoglycan biosynthesis protein ExoA
VSPPTVDAACPADAPGFAPLSSGRGPGVSLPLERPFLSLILPVRNEERFIRGTLEQIIRQTYPPERYEVLVVDGRSTDGTRCVVAEFAAMHPQVRILDNPRLWSSAGRNIGFRAARGDSCLVLDGHCHIGCDRLLEQVASAFATTEADCLGRAQPLDPPGLTRFQRVVALARASWMGHSMESLIYSEAKGFVSPVSVGAAYRKSVFERIGYVDEDFDASEDVEFNYRAKEAGLTCYVDPAFTVRYYPRDNCRGLLRQMFRYGRGRARFVRKHPAALNLDMTTPAAFVLLVLAMLASIVVAPRVAWFLGGVASVYAALVLWESVQIARREGIHGLLTAPVILLSIHVGIGTGFLFEFIAAPWRRLGKRKEPPGPEGASACGASCSPASPESQASATSCASHPAAGSTAAPSPPDR